MGHRSKGSRSTGRPLIRDRAIAIGVIADTHGVYDPAIERHFAGVKEMFHAGDIGGAHVIQRLRRLAPVTAVSGNVDHYEASGFPRRLVVRRSGFTIALCHVLYEGGKLVPDAAAWLEEEQPDVCVFGHSHRPEIARHGRTVLFNPGSAGPRRFSLPRGIGILTLSPRKATPRLIRLDDRVVAGPATSSARAKGVSK